MEITKLIHVRVIEMGDEGAGMSKNVGILLQLVSSRGEVEGINRSTQQVSMRGNLAHD